MKFSVIVAVYNGAETLQQCIDSVMQQTDVSCELIIIDGGSTDETISLLNKNQEHIAYWISEPDSGIYSAWNKALIQANGDWICFLGADDFFLDSSVLKLMAVQLEKLSPDILVAYGKMLVLNICGESLYLVGEPWDQCKGRFKQVMCLPHPGAMHHRRLFINNGIFDESFHIAGDYEFLLRELKTKSAFFMPEIIAVGMRQGGISSNPKNALIALREFRRAQKMHGQNAPQWIWLLAVSRVYIRLILWVLFGEKFTRKALDVGRRIMGLDPHWTKT